MFLGVTHPGPSAPGGSVHPGPGIVAPGLTPRPLLAPDGVLFDKQERDCSWKQGRCVLGSHRPSGAHIRGLPRGPQLGGQTGAAPGGAGGSQNEVRQPSLPTGMGTLGRPPPAPCHRPVAVIPCGLHKSGSGIRMMTWGQARSSLGDSRSGTQVPAVGQRGLKDVRAPSPPAPPAVRPRTGGV